jgi:thiol-disulfide isomerase/thioredoxin
MRLKLTLFFFFIAVSSFAQLNTGYWWMYLQLNDSVILPVLFEVKTTIDTDTVQTIEFINAEERIEVTNFKYEGDSVFFRMPVFDSEFRMKMSDHGNMKGYFYNYARTDKNKIPARAFFPQGMMSGPIPDINLSGRWEVRFKGDEPPLDLSVGIFKQDEDRLTGTFLTSTGDYRYLSGKIVNNIFYMSAFDGSHLFYFRGTYEPDKTIKGHFYSGMHWHDTWTAKRNDNAELPNPDSLTFLKPGFKKLEFAFPDADSNMVSLSDKKFKKKVVVVQIMGSWCPNCMDETKFLADYYSKNKNRGFEIIGLDYERIAKFSTAKNNLKRLKKQYNIDYTLLFAGSTDKVARAKTLPMLSDILAFPTTIYLDKKGRVRRIHTGFSGPATGRYYEKWKEDFSGFIDKLMEE